MTYVAEAPRSFLLFWGRYQKGKSWCRDEFDGAVVILSLRESALFGKTLTV